ncbi:sel1 repeat family protein, partial [Escherichia coli]|nr:sel1 repeat family protein [Escherichia coli]
SATATQEPSIEQITQLAQKGDPKAQFQLGERYFKGLGVSQDSKAAAEWFIKAGNQGNSDAQFRLGTMFVNGFGVRRDYDKAMLWYEQA